MATGGQRTPSGIFIAQAIGLSTSFYLLGQNATFSVSTIPAVMEAPAPLAARQWKKVFDQGKIVGPALAVASTLATGYLAYEYSTSSRAGKLNLAATILFPSIVPYTFALMGSTNRALISKADSLAATALSDKAAEAGVAKNETVHALLDKWATLNLGRAIITGVGAILALWAALDKVEIFAFRDLSLGTGANRLG
ncbi:hypothetical protein BCR34DRAFT_201939 [Clohesyomyces aquaticus]|uniref:DUF1772-domain-containing protein n=1 Tax=Clohesyomyces aquaticus TaxID=1231657 RepID=A0A1Y1ZXG6_9PLEO|nr:hypothetical protein BCR34DRAFT_201939 [Clohesyomyces aquaticus]